MYQAMPRQFCPKCPPEMVGKNRDRPGGPFLELLVLNYHGTGVDIVRCPSCLKQFEVTYKIEAITEITGP